MRGIITTYLSLISCLSFSQTDSVRYKSITDELQIFNSIPITFEMHDSRGSKYLYVVNDSACIEYQQSHFFEFACGKLTIENGARFILDTNWTSNLISEYHDSSDKYKWRYVMLRSEILRIILRAKSATIYEEDRKIKLKKIK